MFPHTVYMEILSENFPIRQIKPHHSWRMVPDPPENFDPPRISSGDLGRA